MTNVNANRLDTLDFVRGLSVLIMIMVHTLWMYGSHETQTSSMLGTIVHLLGKGTAAFLVAMGISLMLSSRQTPAALFRRGLMLMGVALLLNTMKFIVPIEIFGTMPEPFIAAYGWQAPLTFSQLQFMLLTGDILQLAAVSLFIIAPLKALHLPRFSYLALTVIVALASHPLRGVQWDLPGLSYASQLLFSDSYQVYFPVFPWISAIFAGMFLGDEYQRKQKHAPDLFKLSAVTGLIMMAVSAPLMLSNFELHFANFFHLKSGGIFYLTGLNLFGLWVAYRTRHLWQRTPLFALLRYASKHVTSLYVLQWTLICWGMGIVGYASLNSTSTLLVMLAMLGIVLCSHVYLHKFLTWLLTIYLPKASRFRFHS